MKITLTIISTLLLFCIVSYGEDLKVVKGKHLEVGLSCEDCHNVKIPEKRAPASSCISCHGEIPGVVKEYDFGTKVMVNPHDSHDGQLRCTLCHYTHGESKLYCSQCHEFKDMIIK